MSRSHSTNSARLCRLLVAMMALVSPACIRFPDVPPPARVPVAAPQVVARPVVKTPPPDTVDVWLIGDNLHTGLVFPYDWLLESGYVPPAGFSHPEYVTMSWGERVAYVQEAWLNPWQVFRAFCTPSPAVMEIIPVNGAMVDVFRQQRIYRKIVPRQDGPRLAAFLNHVSRMGPDGRPIIVGPSSWGEGFLLESAHSYHLPRICNAWTGEAMEACGCELNLWFGLTADGLIRQATHPRNGFDCTWRGDKVELPKGSMQSGGAAGG